MTALRGIRRDRERYELHLPDDAEPVSRGSGHATVYIRDAAPAVGFDTQIACKVAAIDPESLQRIERERFYFHRMIDQQSFPVPYVGAWQHGDAHVITEYDPTFVEARTYLKNLGDGAGLFGGPDDLLSLCQALLDSVGALHTIGIVHCDIKPDNVLLRREGRRRYGVRLIDLGHAHSLEGWDSPVSATGIDKVGGTEGWISPSRLQGVTSEQADVWGVALLALAFLLGDPDPLRRASKAEVTRHRVEERLEEAAELIATDSAPFRFLAGALRETIGDHRHALTALDETRQMMSADWVADVESDDESRMGTETIGEDADEGQPQREQADAGSVGGAASAATRAAAASERGGMAAQKDRPIFRERFYQGRTRFPELYGQGRRKAREPEPPPWWEVVDLRLVLGVAVAGLVVLSMLGALMGWW
jgi:hypothetical protein